MTRRWGGIRYVKYQEGPTWLPLIPQFDCPALQRVEDEFELRCWSRCLDLAERACRLEPGETAWWQLRAVLQFRSSVYGDLDQRRAAVHRLVALLIGGLEEELAGTLEWPKLRGFLDGEFRRNLVSLSIYVKSLELAAAHDRLRSAAGRDGRSRIQTEPWLRMAQYFFERGYLTPSQLPDWIYAVDQAMQERPGPLIAMIQRWLASRIGVPADQPVPRVVGAVE